MTGANTARPSRSTNTPSVSFRSCPGGGSFDAESVGSTAFPRRRREELSSRTMLPFGSKSISRTVSAWMGTDTTFFRVAVVISAVQVKPGRTSGTSSSIVMTTLNVVACRWPPVAPAA